METIDSIIHFWFGNHNDPALVVKEKAPLWWLKNPDVDQEIKQRFEPLIEALTKGELDEWRTSPRGVLASVLLTDQFSRNMYRGQAKSFAFDTVARTMAKEAVANNIDQTLRPIERVFIYMPLEHSENRADQQKSVGLFEQLQQEVTEEHKTLFQGYVDFACKHKEIIDRFNRFPHRNEILGRVSTEEELAFLKQPGSSF